MCGKNEYQVITELYVSHQVQDNTNQPLSAYKTNFFFSMDKVLQKVMNVGHHCIGPFRHWGRFIDEVVAVLK